MGIFKKVFGISIICLASIVNLFAASSSNNDDDTLSHRSSSTIKGIHRYHKAHGIWRLSFDSLVSGSGTSSFQFIVKSPRGKIYSSEVLSSAALPSNVTIELKNPVKGNYLVCAKIISVTGIATITYSATTSNTKNNSVYKLTPAGFTAFTTSSGTEIIIGSFSIPH